MYTHPQIVRSYGVTMEPPLSMLLGEAFCLIVTLTLRPYSELTRETVPVLTLDVLFSETFNVVPSTVIQETFAEILYSTLEVTSNDMLEDEYESSYSVFVTVI